MSTLITQELRERIRRLESAAGRRRLVLPFGLKEIDRHLAGGGLALSALHEVAGGGHGAIDGAAAALFAAGIAARLMAGCSGVSPAGFVGRRQARVPQAFLETDEDRLLIARLDIDHAIGQSPRSRGCP
jgi:hypothetical protein